MLGSKRSSHSSSSCRRRLVQAGKRNPSSCARRDAEHLLQLMVENHFPRIWVPTPENRDLRQLVLHRHRFVGMRTRVMNQLQAIAMNEGVRRKRGLWTEKGRAQL